MKEKLFRVHLEIIFDKLINGQCFAFNRFSDGELYILKNQELILDNSRVKVGTKETKALYNAEDHKHFCPLKHKFFRDRLIDAFVFESENYYTGISCRCCVGFENFNYQINLFHENGISCDNLTWANLFLNGNYPDFINFIFPVFLEYKIVIVCNEIADLSAFTNLVKDFRVGYNAMINDYQLINCISEWISSEHVEGHLFLFSASTFSKFAIHQLYQKHPCNTYIDIGTTLNPLIGMRSDRTYLRQFWLSEKGSDLQKICIW